MPHVITALCLRDGSCSTVCPVDCIVSGEPIDEYPTYFVDPETCIDCGACETECPYGAIMPEDEIPSDYIAKGGEVMNMPTGTEGFDDVYEGEDHDGNPIKLTATRKLEEGEEIDLTPAIDRNADYFQSGPGYTG